MPILRNPETGQVIDIPATERELADAQRLGFTEEVQSASTTQVRTSTGLQTVPDAAAQELVQEGFGQSTAVEEEGAAREAALDRLRSRVGIADQVAAAARGAGSALTLGAISADGPRGTLQEIITQEETSTARTAGVIGGTALSLFTPGGVVGAAGKTAKASALGKAVGVTPLGLTVRTGTAVANRVAAQTGSKVLGFTAGGLVEGGLFGAATAATRVLHSDKEFSAETLAAEVFRDGIQNSLLGGAFGLGGGLVLKAAGRIKANQLKAANPALDLTSEAGKRLSLEASRYGQMSDDVIRTAKRLDPQASRELQRAARRIERSVGTKLSSEDFLAKLAGVPERKIGKVLKDIDNHAKLMDDIGAKVGQPDLSATFNKEQVASALGVSAKRGTGVEIGTVDGLAYLEAAGITDFVPNSGIANFLVDAYAAQRIAKTGAAAAKGLTGAAAKNAKSTGILSKALGGAHGIATAPVAALGGIVGRAKKAVGGAAKGFVKGVAATQKAHIPAGLSIYEKVSFDFTGTNPPEKGTQDVHSRAARMFDEIHRAGANLLTTQQAILKRMPDLVAVDPVMADSVATTMANKVYYLSNQAPKIPPKPAIPGATRLRFSETELSAFADKLRATLDPLTLLDDLQNGKLTTAKVEAVRATSPRVFADIQDKVMQEILESGEKMPYTKRVQLSILFDLPGDVTMEPAFIQDMQRRIAARKQDNTPGPQPTAKYSNVTTGAQPTETQKLSS